MYLGKTIFRYNLHEVVYQNRGYIPVRHCPLSVL